MHCSFRHSPVFKPQAPDTAAKENRVYYTELSIRHRLRALLEFTGFNSFS